MKILKDYSFEEDEYTLKLLDGEFLEGEVVTVDLHGKIYKRVVRDRRDCGLYIVINNTMYFLTDLEGY